MERKIKQITDKQAWENKKNRNMLYFFFFFLLTVGSNATVTLQSSAFHTWPAESAHTTACKLQRHRHHVVVHHLFFFFFIQRTYKRRQNWFIYLFIFKFSLICLVFSLSRSQESGPVVDLWSNLEMKTSTLPMSADSRWEAQVVSTHAYTAKPPGSLVLFQVL